MRLLIHMTLFISTATNQPYSYRSRAGCVTRCRRLRKSYRQTGVVITTSGPGATNIVTGIATANIDSIPVVAITGNVTTDQLGRDSFQEVDIVNIVKPITKASFIVEKSKTLLLLSVRLLKLLNQAEKVLFWLMYQGCYRKQNRI